MDSFHELRRQLLILGIFRCVEAIAWTSIFPYVYFMIQSFDQVPDDNKAADTDAGIAFYAGVMVSVFTFCEFLSATVWARVSDHIGRRPTLLLGIVGSILSALSFGFSRSLAAAVAARAIGGLLNPNVGVVQTCVGELAKRKEQQAKAFSYVPFLRGLGSLLGPVLGGLLAEPTKLYPNVFPKGSVWEDYPFLLPNLVVVVLFFISLLVGTCFLEETHPTRTKPDRELPWLRSLWIMISEARMFRRWFTYTQIKQDETRDARSPDYEDHAQDQETVELEELNVPAVPLENDDVSGSKPPSAPSAFTTQVILQIVAVSLLAYHKVSSDIIIPTFLATPKQQDMEGTATEHRSIFHFNGGFGLNIQSISHILLSQALVAIIAQMFVIPAVVERYGPLLVFRCTISVFPLMYVLTPYVAQLPRLLSITFILVDLWIKVVLSSAGSICSGILITNTVPSRIHLARINGIAASMGCLARSVGPLVSGQLFDWGSRTGYVGVAFWALGAVALCGAIESWFLKDYP
ncbi:MFS general substrate transporter [Aulographum hederae CBS 113979]|uniref:MFS general substrate transporter n=1 Tax=Aulographum hederae CBS 113979 TaxID=1176131 RepID=A0A6G1GNF7_9PEZI|nr:MFS general substrate transporter [Aulographum hederae CBS 113979]